MVARFSGLNLFKLKQTLTKVHHSGEKCGLVETLLSKVENFTLAATYEFNLWSQSKKHFFHYGVHHQLSSKLGIVSNAPLIVHFNLISMSVLATPYV